MSRVGTTAAAALRNSLLGIWGATLAGALFATAGITGVDGNAPRDALDAEPGTAAALLAHNAPVALWPLGLVAIGWPALQGVRALGDLLVAGQLISHGVIVGSAFGHHPALWRYLPHLPFEWLAIAMPAAAWLRARAMPVDHTCGAVGLAGLAAACLAVLSAAAAIETYLVPVT
jgi:hypothetical protein